MATNARGAPPGRASRPHLTAASPPSTTKADATVAREPVILADAVTELVEHSDHIDTLLRLRLAAYREGYAAAELAHRDDYECGYHDGCMAVKHVQHEAHGLAEVDARRWMVRGEKRSRQTYGRPHPDDFKGNGAA